MVFGNSMKTPKNFKFLALFLISSIILVTAASTATSVNAQSQASVYVYDSRGGNISANGTQLHPQLLPNIQTATLSFTQQLLDQGLLSYVGTGLAVQLR